MTRLEHVNVTVADPDKTAALLCGLFGWHVRWQGVGMETGRTVHVGSDESYVALFSYGDAMAAQEDTYRTRGGMNHIAVVVDDLDAVQRRVVAAGYVAGAQRHYEPGKRFYFREENGIEVEVVCYA
jgi:catechol 2,3-dioxygenase-like lactoylglutathione lyase family enzyme